ncbi:citrate lyase holo-[acyl-carrier protein] synthase [Ligilactobacillus sp. LYQ139]|uniref:citrate lyase holo-[acyl-carrier protein] synthase n=1 Tax=Ligilactobacillus sp. LYQ139 TaxID=3378800 RepID=UPI003851E4CC
MEIVERVFAGGSQQDIPAVLANRDQRAAQQRQLVETFPGATVIAVKLNIPGPVKTSPVIRRFFREELTCFEKQLAVAGRLILQVVIEDKRPTGPERFYVVRSAAQAVKHLTVAFETATPAARLFDMDVLVKDKGVIRPISREEVGLSARRCLLCDRLAKDCGRSRRHSVSALQAKVAALVMAAVNAAKRERVVQRLATLAVRALINEAAAWPKPGLVDPVEHGAHPDMDYPLFVQSALALEGYFRQCARMAINYSGKDYPALFDTVRQYGIQAEHTMMQATGNVNTHKGAIFALGILVTATASCWQTGQVTLKTIQHRVQALLTHLTDDFTRMKRETPQTAGEVQYHLTGRKGARGEAEAGFPVIFEVGLPVYKQTQGTTNDRIITAFLALAQHVQDSTLYKRAGTDAIEQEKQRQVTAIIEAGGIVTPAGRKLLDEMQAEYSNRHLSLGGVADMVSGTLLMAEIEEEFCDASTNE